MLHKITGATIGVALILLLLLKFEVIGGTIATIAVVVLFAASCVLALVSWLSGRKPLPVQPKPAQPIDTAQPTPPADAAPESPMQVACRYIRSGDALKAQGKIREAIDTYREGEEMAKRDPALGPTHAMTFLLRCAARDLEEASRKKSERRR